MIPKSLVMIASLALAQLPLMSTDQCTAAVFAPASAEGGRPMLWKNRDTGELSNRVVFVKEQPFSYLAVVDKDDPSGRIVWAGLNEAGFAIMNTASYNLPQKKGEAADQEGLIMAQALRRCRSVEDFEYFLRENFGPNLGVSTNFGVMDAEGKAMLLEVHNHGLQRFDPLQAPGKFLWVTNFSRSGNPKEGAGRIRMERVEALEKIRKPGPFHPQEIFRDFARDTGHPLLESQTWPEFKQLDASRSHWIHCRHTINRWDTACSVVLVGKDPAQPLSRPMMWILTGEPLLSVALPLWVEAGTPPEVFWKGREAPLWGETLRLKSKVRRDYGKPEKQEYLDVTQLDNKAGSGFLPTFLKMEEQNFLKTREFLQQPRTPEELRRFQADLANQTIQLLKETSIP